MEVNICYRLIRQMINKGTNFCSKFDTVNGMRAEVTTNAMSQIPKGLYATKNYTKDSIIHRLEGVLCLKPTKESIHIGNGLHVIDKFYGKYINHSFEQNTKIELNKIIAIRDINKGEELTFNYNDSELEMACPFEYDDIKVCGKKVEQEKNVLDDK